MERYCIEALTLNTNHVHSSTADDLRLTSEASYMMANDDFRHLISASREIWPIENIFYTFNH